MSGEKTNSEYAHINVWGRENAHTPALADHLRYCTHPVFEIDGNEFVEPRCVTAGNYISGKELPIFMSLPQKSVSGVTVTSMAEFSRNVSHRTDETAATRKWKLGCIHHMGKDETENKVVLDLDSLTSHCFICGSTGSGKSSTTYHLLHRLIRANIPFLVIEPAKGEYKTEFGGVPDINIFGSNPYMGALLKINPFEFHPQIHILEHLDRLIEIFNACWEMYAAMPAILKNAVETAYVRKGWDLLNSIYIGEGQPQFPTFDDLLTTLPEIIQTSSYSADTQSDYIGALVTRVHSLTNGITGQIFCDSYSISDSVLFDETTIVDLSRIGSTETKSLIMGILVMRLTEYRVANAMGSNRELCHVTILEEAHNLLKNVSQAQGQQTANPIGKSVEMICNSIAELRTYGEGFVIVDQSPSAVDIAAIKNTNTKIAMRLPEKADCEAVGNSLGLNEIQIRELSKLPVGVAAVLQNNWLEAVLCKIEKVDSIYYKETEKTDFETVRKLRSIVLEKLILQYQISRKIDTASIFLSIDDVDACCGAKIEIKNRLVALAQTVNESDNYRAFYIALLSISGLKSAFCAAENEIKAHSTDAKSLSAWKDGIIKKMHSLFVFSDASIYEKLFMRSVFAMRWCGGALDYPLIYKTLFVESNGGGE
ncbi:MAG: DUF87 domain-containing protein [Methanocorpusculum sp.]|nr:DUF87 domain-containing protein [Methanocorpusculum sp.]